MRHGRMIAGVAGVSVVVTGLALSGCSRATRYRMDPSPRVDTRAQTEQEIQNALTITNDSNFRYFWNDMGRLWMMNKRSMLDPGPNF